MGQQQLLLVILVTIIVGIATVVAINIFGTAAEQSNRDAVRQDLLAASVQAQGIWARPSLMGGVDRDFSNATAGELLRDLNIPSNSYNRQAETPVNELNNENGSYSVTTNTEFVLAITAEPSSGGNDIILTMTRDQDTGNWIVDIDGNTTDEGE